MKQQLKWIPITFVLLGFAAVSSAKDAKDTQDDKETKNKGRMEHCEEAKQGLKLAKLSAKEAIDAAMKKVPGGKAVQVDLKVEKDKPQFEVEIVDTNRKHMEVKVDGVSGDAGKAVEEKQSAETNEDDEKAEDGASQAKVTLSQAIDAAQKRVTDGKIFAACSEMQNDKPIFSIELLSGDKTVRAQIDCTSGKVLDVKNINHAQAKITKVNAKQGTVTVKMKDANGKEVEKTFTLTEDIEYFDSTGNVAELDIFTSGDEVLFIEADGKIEELKKDSKTEAKAENSSGKTSKK